MTDINRVAVIGRLTRDLGTDEREFGYLPNGTARANISIAVNSSKDFHAEGELAEPFAATGGIQRKYGRIPRGHSVLR